MRFFVATAVGLALASSATAVPFPSQSKDDVWKDLRGKITHVVYLMMENHSFDNIAGFWKFRDDIDNLVHTPHCNNYNNENYTIYGEPLLICAKPYEQEVPLHDPDHNFAGTSFELYEKWDPTSDDVPTMGGFVNRESDKYSSPPGQAAFVINAYDEEKTKTLTYIAKNFAFFDSYHAEHPGPTNPNRMFATSGSTCGYVDNTDAQSTGWFSNVTGIECATSIFESLSKKGISWKNYYESDIIDSYIYKYVQDHDMDRIVHADQFYKDIQEGTLPQFSYINPECCSVDSMHPTSNAAAGEQLIKHVYDAIRNSKYWDTTLFILNFDEHGGFADHVPPPTNIPKPEDGITFSGISDDHNVTYDFSRLGVRVPAFVISPWVKPGTLIHDKGTSYASDSAYTHTSFLHFLQNLWELEGLNNRVQWAKTFEYIFEDKMINAPKQLPTPEWVGDNYDVQPAAFYKLNQPYSYYANL
ncbi:phosphatidylglycerol specific phospholipase [Dipodascopsis uninucleata]